MTELPTSLIVLEYIKAFLSWPVVVGLLVIIFILRFKDVITALMGRITGMELPGVKLEIPRFDPEKSDTVANTTNNLESRKDEVVASDHSGQKVKEIDKDFDSFYVNYLSTKMFIINDLVTELWNKSGFALFNKERPKKAIDAIKVLGDHIDQNTIPTLETIKATYDEFVNTGKVDRKRFLTSVQKSEILINFLRRVLTIK